MNPSDHPRQGTTHLDLRHDRGLVSALACDSRRKTKLSKHTLRLRDIFSRTNLELVPLIAPDGFAFYAKVIRRVFGPACLYGQVIKTRSNDRIVRVERRAVIGAYWRLEKMLADSEDSSKLNPSFIERLNLTIRQ